MAQEKQTALTQEEKDAIREREVEFLKKDIEYLKVKAEHEELIARIEVAQRNHIAAYRDRIYILAEMKENENEPAKNKE